MTPENQEGIAYLTALKRLDSGETSTSAPASVASATAPGQASSPKTFSGPEKRRSSRYKCEGSIEMREEGCDVRTWATFTDISLHGCYVEAQATYPPGTILQMKLEANGIRFESKGDVRVNYPYLGMGIAFVEMSAENQMRLQQLQGVVAAPSVVAAAPTGASAPLSPRAAWPGNPLPDPKAAVEATKKFFDDHATLTREEFQQILRRTQTSPR